MPGLDRIAAVDLAVMRVAVWEMLENDEVSPIIVIDEAISIVRSISTDTSPSFVNAVLDAIRKDLASPAWSRRSADEDEGRGGDAPISSSDEVLPVQEAPARSLPAGAKPLDGGSVEDELDELLEEY